MISEMRLENMEEKSWCFLGDICDFMEAQNSKEYKYSKGKCKWRKEPRQRTAARPGRRPIKDLGPARGLPA